MQTLKSATVSSKTSVLIEDLRALEISADIFVSLRDQTLSFLMHISRRFTELGTVVVSLLFVLEKGTVHSFTLQKKSDETESKLLGVNRHNYVYSSCSFGVMFDITNEMLNREFTIIIV